MDGGIVVACAIYIRIFIVVLHRPYKKIIEKQYACIHIAIISSFQILHHLLLSYLI